MPDDLLEAEPEHDVEAAAHGQHAVHAGGRVVGQLVEDDLVGPWPMPGLATKISLGVALEPAAEQLRHHAAQRGDDELAECRERVVGVLQRRQVDDQDAAVEHDVAHVDVAESRP